MPRFLHQLSGILFYVIGATFFLSYVLMRNDILLPWSAWWLQAARLPFMLVAMMFGGFSVYLSLAAGRSHSRFLATMIAAPLVVFLLFLIVVNFQ
ncbi:MAG: hypothetical protein Greene041619_12 [Candidatus Peregrinibacteria bacterium Greene0416_19]|nr:MAG: hypothetical protein Greene041619_12 [Candidatus Peregrinibacteria bacterium Greene0416_19]